MVDTGYSVSATPVSGPSSGADKTKDSYWTVDKCKKAYLDYLFNKTQEIEEQKNARRYYHGAHWTAEQIKKLNQRKQPVVTFNRIGRKIDGVVGLIERLRQDPKAYARTPEHDEGAELATAVLRYVLDEEEWKAKSPAVARDAAVDGIGGVEIEITQGDHNDPEISFEVVEPDSFFYDPRSYRNDFTDARYMGVGKWMDLDAAIELFPDKKEELEAVGTFSAELSTNPDREKRWFTEVGNKRLVRLIEIWYKAKGDWNFAVFTGYSILTEGKSYFLDNKKKTFSKYVMFSANRDHDGDRYGFVRNMKDAQDEYNSRRSKALHQINSRRLIVTKGGVQNIEEVRREWARPDGVVEINSADVQAGVKADDQSFDFAGQLKLMENAIAELENYGPNQALIGDQTNQSGRAIQLLQQAGMAELGPYILGYRGWKLRLYRAIWCAVQQFWTAQRWVRVTDDQQLKNFMAINQSEDENGNPLIHPQTGQPMIQNPIGDLDVDIIIDEGPDQVNMQADSYDTLTVLAKSGAQQIPWQVLLELSPIQASVKKKILDMANQPDPVKQQAQQLELQGKAAENDKTKSETIKNLAQAHAEGMPDAPAQMQPKEYEVPAELQNAQAVADINKTNAEAQHKHAQTFKTTVEATIAPQQAEHQARMDQANLQQAAHDKSEDRALAAKAAKQKSKETA